MGVNAVLGPNGYEVESIDMPPTRWSDSTGTALVRPDGALTPPASAFPARTIIIGDSYASLHLVTQATALDYPIRAEFIHANVELGWPWDIVGNTGAAGETAAQISARAIADIATYEPAWVLIPGGAFINSINADASYSSIQSSLEAIFDACRGRKVVWCTAPVNALYLTTATRRDAWARVNRWALEQCRARGFVGVDTTSTITDPATGNELSNRLADNLHPNTMGASQMSRAIVRAVRLVYGLQGSPLIATSQWAGKNLIYNPFASGSNSGGAGGFTAGSLTGVGPDGWEGAVHASGAGVGSKVAFDDEVPCDWARIAVTASVTKNSGAGWVWRLLTTTTWASTTAYQVGNRRVPTVANGFVYRAIAAGTSGGTQPTWPTTPGATVTDGTVTWRCYDAPAVGDTIQAALEFRLSSWSAGANAALYVECLDGGSSTLLQGAVMFQRQSDDPPAYVMPSGVLVTPAMWTSAASGAG